MATPEATLFSMLRRDTLGIRSQSLPEKKKYVNESFLTVLTGLGAPRHPLMPELESLTRLQIEARSRIITGLFVRASTDLAA
jgi:hypothetical protein